MFAAVLVATGGCVHKPMWSIETVADPALCALNDSFGGSNAVAVRTLKYMFCIPNGALARAEVKQIDPTVVFIERERSKKHCPATAQLCVGSTNQPRFRMVLERLSKLPYVERIDLAPAEFY